MNNVAPVVQSRFYRTGSAASTSKEKGLPMPVEEGLVDMCRTCSYLAPEALYETYASEG